MLFDIGDRIFDKIIPLAENPRLKGVVTAPLSVDRPQYHRRGAVSAPLQFGQFN